MKLQESRPLWYGTVPTSWNIKPLKYITFQNQKVLFETTRPDYAFRYVDIGSVNSEIGISEYKEMVFADAPSRARRVVSVGDTIISTVRTYLRAIAFIEDAKDVVVSTGFSVLSPKSFIYPKYLYYFCVSDAFVEDVNKYSSGVTYPAISDDLLGRLEIAFPDIMEQEAIVAFLDNECRKYDSVIEDLESQIACLKHYRRQTINEAVTRGLRANVKTKASGNPFVGEIADTAEAIRFKYVASIDADLVDPVKYAKMPQVSPENIVSNMGELVDVQTVEESSVDSWNQRFFKGQIIYSKIRPALNKVTVAPYDGLCSADMYPISTVLPTRYLMYYMLSDAFVLQTIDVSSIRVKMPKVNQEEMKNFIVVTHPQEEMEEIAEFLDKKCAVVDSLLKDKEAQLEQMKAQRESLIFEYVTGKKRVKEAATNGD